MRGLRFEHCPRDLGNCNWITTHPEVILCLIRLLCVINTTCDENIHLRWCCIDRLNSHRFGGDEQETE